MSEEKERLTIYLTKEQAKNLKHFAIDKGLTMSAYVDWLLTTFIQKKIARANPEISSEASPTLKDFARSKVPSQECRVCKQSIPIDDYNQHWRDNHDGVQL